MYTELFICTSLNLTEDQCCILDYMLGKADTHPVLPEHPLFETDRWHFMLQTNSYYFTPATASLLEFNEISKNYSFIVRSDFKNYSDEVKHFIDWISPLVDDVNGKQMIGYYRYEENDEPTIIYVGD